MTDNNEGRGEIDYHTFRLLRSSEASDEDRLIAIDAIRELTKKSILLLDKDCNDIINLYHSSTNDQLKAELATLLISSWPEHPEVQAILQSTVNSEVLSPDAIANVVHSVRLLLEKDKNKRILPAIRQYVQSAHVLLKSNLQNPEYNYLKHYVVLLLKSIIEINYRLVAEQETMSTLTIETLLNSESNTKDAEVIRDAIRTYLGDDSYTQWHDALLQLESVQQVAKIPGFTYHREHVLRFLQSKTTPLTQAREQQVNAISQILAKDNSILTRDEERALAEQIHAQAVTPSGLIADLFQNGASVVTLDTIAEEYILHLSRIVEEVDSHIHISHIAIHVPEKRKQEFEDFIENNTISPAVQELLSELDTDEIETFREALLSLHALGLSFVYIGSEHFGELHLLEPTKQIRSILQKNPHARIVMLSDTYLPNTFTSSRTGTDDEDSCVPPLIAEFGSTAIASVCVRKESDMFYYQSKKLSFGSDIGEFCEDHGITRSFGIRPKDTILGNKPYIDTSSSTYAQAWDGIIVLLDNDDNDDDWEEAPEAPSSSKPVLAG